MTRIPFARRALLLSAVALFMSACAGGKEPAPAPPVGSAASAPAPAPTSAPAPDALASLPRAASFSGERAWSYMQAQVALGPRGHGLKGHDELRDMLAAHLKACGAEVRLHDLTHRGALDAKATTFTNVLGRFNPKAPRWVLLGTHYDTRLWADEDSDPDARKHPITGANDGASGTAVLMEIASVLKDMPPDIGVEIVFFDGEDYGHPEHEQDYFVGSLALQRDWTKLFGDSKPDAAIVLDMVGDADLAIHREMKSEEAFPALDALIWATARELGEKAFVEKGEQGILDDHDALMALGIPATLLIDYAYPWWHRSGDTLEKCSPASLATVGRVVLASVVDRPPPDLRPQK